MHLKHASPIRRAAQMKRTALVEIYSDETAANATTFAQIEAAGDADARAIVATPRMTAQQAQLAQSFLAGAPFSEEALLAADRAEPSASVKAQRDADLAQAIELSRQPNGGYLG